MNQAMRISENKAWLLKRLSATSFLLLVFLVFLWQPPWICKTSHFYPRILLTPHRSYELRWKKWEKLAQIRLSLGNPQYPPYPRLRHSNNLSKLMRNLWVLCSHLGTCSHKYSLLCQIEVIWGLLEGLEWVWLILYYSQHSPQVLSYLPSEYLNKQTFQLLSLIRIIL